MPNDVLIIYKDRGAQGAQGIQGIQGDKGDKGETGVSFPGSVISNDVILDFGSLPLLSKTFTFTDALATTAHRIMMNAQGGTDDYECEGFFCAAACLVNGIITAEVISETFVKGSYNFNYLLT